jgi:hypothetical protein
VQPTRLLPLAKALCVMYNDEKAVDTAAHVPGALHK